MNLRAGSPATTGSRLSTAVRKVFWTIIPVCWLIQGASYPHNIQPDGISYLDIASSCAKGNWHALVNAYWSPAYSVLMALWLSIVRPSPSREVLSLHFFNALLLLGAFFCFELFLSSLSRYFQSRKDDDEFAGLPFYAVETIAYVLFFWASLYLTPPSLDTPDAMIFGIVLAAGAVLLQIGSGQNGWSQFALLGAVLGFGFLAKAVMFPLAFVFMAFSLVADGSIRRATPKLIVCILVFALISGPFIFALSKSKGRFTFNDTSAIAYAEYINGIALFVHWQGGPPGTGEPKHPERKIFDNPAAYEYATPIGGTYPPWSDPSYWYDGVKPHFQLGNQLNAMRIGFERYFDVFTQLSAVFAGFLVLFFWSRDWAGFFRRTLQLSFLWFPAVAAFGLYSLVHVEDRFLPGFVILLVIALFSAIRFRDAEKNVEPVRAVVWAVVAILGLQIAWSVGHSVIRLASHRPVPEREIVEALNSKGVTAGDRVSFLGDAAFDHYWARLGRFRIVAEVPGRETTAFWAASPEIQSRVIEAFAQVGSQAVLAQNPPKNMLARGWQQIGGTNYYVLFTPGNLEKPSQP
ncbi:MAG TPA: hypothetical protein VGD60_16550 [Candidatus Acidoferrales bacterium]